MDTGFSADCIATFGKICMASEPYGTYSSLFSVENSIIVPIPRGSELARDSRRNREQARSHKTIRVHHQESLSKGHSHQSPVTTWAQTSKRICPLLVPMLAICQLKY